MLELISTFSLRYNSTLPPAYAVTDYYRQLTL
jgi:hypothetical protein